jgi:dihydrofolate synthase / folylpolyglutamate synthase
VVRESAQQLTDKSITAISATNRVFGAMGEAIGYIESLSPWPERFGLERIRDLLKALGEPQRRYSAIHVVGTNGKTTTARTLEAMLAAEGLDVGTFTSPHVTGWSERIRVGGVDADFDRAIARVRAEAESAGATQFETLTAAALAQFAAEGVGVAVVEAGLGGRHDATNVLRSRVQVLTNVALDHTDVLGHTRAEIAREKLAVVQPGSTVVLGEPEWEALAREHGAASVVAALGGNADVAAAAATAFLGRPPSRPVREAIVPGRLERRGRSPLEIWDGGHNPAGIAYALRRLPPGPYVVVASVLADKDAGAMLTALAGAGHELVATQSSSSRALPAGELGERARTVFRHVTVEPDPAQAVVQARARAGRDGAVLVTGSLYLLADLHVAGKTYDASVP